MASGPVRAVTVALFLGIALFGHVPAVDAQNKGTPPTGTGGPDTRDGKDAPGGNVGAKDDDKAAKRLTYPYKVEMTGIDDADIAKTARELSILITDKDRPPATRLGLRRRMEEDAEKLRRYLRSEGYYGARISITANNRVKPAAVTIKITPGTRYKLTVFRILGPKGGGLKAAPRLADIGVELGTPGRSAMIVNAQARVLAILADRGYPFAEVAKRQVIVDHAQKSVEVTLHVDLGGLTRFGATRIEGLKRTKPGFVKNSIDWKEGDVYDAEKVRATRRNLLETGVVGSITIVPQQKERGTDGRAPMVITLRERKPRTFEFGASYSTDNGPGGSVSWLHRNLFGRGERLLLAMESTVKDRFALSRLTFPNFFRRAQSLILESRLGYVQYDAYDGIIWSNTAIVERRINKHLRISGGISFERSALEQTGVTERYSLFGLPMALRFDDTDSLLNPTKGVRIDLELTPFQGTGPRGGVMFAHVGGRISSYWKPWEDRNLVLAGWLRLATVVGEERRNIPANKRLYAGGGGSVRGFAFQRISPLDSSNDPVGGRSLVAFGAEARFRISGSWGGVFFLEGGSVTEDVVPKFAEPVRWGVGFGVRYYTSFGPVRLDVAFPINRRKGDGIIQVYISIGQAF